MAVLEISYDDLLAFKPDLEEKKAEIMSRDAIARAKQLAPFLAFDLEQDVADAANAIIRKAVLRWADAGSGGLTQKSQTAGAFTQAESYDNRQESKVLFFPSEIDELKALGPVKPQKGKAFSINMAPNAGTPQPNPWR